MFKIHGNKTENTSTNLCDTCRNMITREYANGKILRNCSQLPNPTQPVVKCQCYSDAKETPLYQHQEIGWRAVKIDDKITFWSPLEIRHKIENDEKIEFVEKDDLVH